MSESYANNLKSSSNFERSLRWALSRSAFDLGSVGTGKTLCLCSATGCSWLPPELQSMIWGDSSSAKMGPKFHSRGSPSLLSQELAWKTHLWKNLKHQKDSMSSRETFSFGRIGQRAALSCSSSVPVLSGPILASSWPGTLCWGW